MIQITITKINAPFLTILLSLVLSILIALPRLIDIDIERIDEDLLLSPFLYLGTRKSRGFFLALYG